jgi:hypothetical protein
MAGRSTLSLPDCIDQGKVLYVHFPIAERRLMAQTVGTLIKVEYGRQVLMRNNKPRPSFFFCEEFQVFFTPTMRQTMQTSSNVRAVRTTQTSSPTQNFPAMLRGRGGGALGPQPARQPRPQDFSAQHRSADQHIGIGAVRRTNRNSCRDLTKCRHCRSATFRGLNFGQRFGQLRS